MAQSYSTPRVLAPFCVVAAVMLLCAAILANSMTKPVGRDEQMYCTAGALLAQGKMIYRDFSYPSQLPYHPLLLAALYRGLGTSYYLLTARLLSVISDVLAVLCILGIYRSVFGVHRLHGLLFGLAAVILYLFNPIVDYALGYAWNHDVVILCVVVSLWVFVTTDFQSRSRFWRIALMSVLLTVATFMRVTTALVEVLFLLAVLVAACASPRGARSCIRAALCFSVAGIVTAAWPIWIIARAPEAFRLNLVRIPALYGRWLHDIGIVHGKLALTVAAFLTPGYLVLLTLVVLAMAVYLTSGVRRHPSNFTRQEKWRATVSFSLPLLFFVIAYVPPTIWEQYLAVPVPFLVIALAYPLAALVRGQPRGMSFSPWGRPRIVACVLGVGAVTAILANSTFLYRAIAVLVPENWTPVSLHRTSADIAAKTEQPRLALTLGPLYAIEGGCDIYPELSCGPIVYRIADQLSADERQLVHAVGPKTLSELFTPVPPTVVIVGVEPSYFSFLEAPLRQSIPPDWRRETYDQGLEAYLRP
jgi:hypothetical protein